MPCIFCEQQRKMSNEHLWPKWAQGTLDGTQPKTVFHSIEPHDRPPREWSAPIFSSTLKGVCERCNSDWMSDIEKAAQPVAEPLIEGRTQALDNEAQGALSVWTYLKVLLFERLDDRQRMLPDRRYRKFHHYASRGEFGLPVSALVFTATHEGNLYGQYQRRGLARRRFLRTPKVDLFVGTITTQRLVLPLSEHLLGRHPEAPPRHRSLQRRDRRIWPVGATFNWPPRPPLSDDELWMFAGPVPAGGR